MRWLTRGPSAIAEPLVAIN